VGVVPLPRGLRGNLLTAFPATRFVSLHCRVALGIVALVVSSVFFYFGGGLIVFFVSVEVSFFFSFDCTWLFLYQYMPGNALVNGFSKKKKDRHLS
jgi:hypothetical protein